MVTKKENSVIAQRQEHTENKALNRAQRQESKLKAHSSKLKARQKRQQELKNLPSYLQVPPRQRASLIASGILQSFLRKCCIKGCIKCHFIGWVRAKKGTIQNQEPEILSTGDYAALHNLSYKTVARHIDKGQIPNTFKVPGSTHRYIIATDEKEKDKKAE